MIAWLLFERYADNQSQGDEIQTYHHSLLLSHFYYFKSACWNNFRFRILDCGFIDLDALSFTNILSQGVFCDTDL